MNDNCPKCGRMVSMSKRRRSERERVANRWQHIECPREGETRKMREEQRKRENAEHRQAVHDVIARDESPGTHRTPF